MAGCANSLEEKSSAISVGAHEPRRSNHPLVSFHHAALK